QAPLEEVRTLARGGSEPDANFTVQLRFANGTTAQLLYTTLGNAGLLKERVEAFLGNEIVVVDDFRSVQRSGAGLRPARSTKVDKGYEDEWKAFHAACVRGPALPIPLEELRSVA